MKNYDLFQQWLSKELSKDFEHDDAEKENGEWEEAAE